MSELRSIKLKHKLEDSSSIRRAVKRIECMRKIDPDVLQVLLYLTNTARLIDQAFEAKAEPEVPSAK